MAVLRKHRRKRSKFHPPRSLSAVAEASLRRFVSDGAEASLCSTASGRGQVPGNRVARGLPFCETDRHEIIAQNVIRPAPSDIAARVDAIDWTQASRDLDAQGCAVLKGLLSAEECRALAALYPDDKHFRSRVVMGRHGFGRGEYKYFAYPLPDLIAELRPALYAHLAAWPTAGTKPWASISAIPIGTRRS